MPKLVRRHWEADLGAFGGRRARQGFHYQAYVPDSIAALELALPGDVAQGVAEAEQEVRALNLVPPVAGSLETLARQLLRAESVASSRIEGLELSHRRLARAAFGPTSDLTAQSVLANMKAMEVAVRVASGSRAIGVKDLLKLHRTLLGGGAIRTEQNWIGGASSSPRDAEFIPPPPEEVPSLLEDLCRFLAREDLPAVVQAAIVHAQFETIHPFADGNGRIGRCLIHVVLRRRGLAVRYVPPVSLILATNSRAYVGGLTDYRAGHIAEWCAVFAAATRTAAREACRFAGLVGHLQARWRLQAKGPRSDSAASTLISALPAHPLLDVKAAASIAQCSNQAARLALAQLEAAKVVARINVGKRNRAWEAVGLFDLINHFEQHLATRQGGTTRMRPAPRQPGSPR